MDPQALYVQLGRLIEAMPDLMQHPQPVATTQWLARAFALVKIVNPAEANEIKDGMYSLSSGGNTEISRIYTTSITQTLYRALAEAELRAPAAAQGAFISAGNAFDALAALGKVLGAAHQDLLIVDPYMDEKILTDFAALAGEKVGLRLLADQKSVKVTLKPASQRWSQQYGAQRPLEVRLSAPRALHDRLIIVDGAEAWILTQSFNGFAARSPASISRSDPDVVGLKIPYYESVWAGAALL
jgi:hypothetical protein